VRGKDDFLYSSLFGTVDEQLRILGHSLSLESKFVVEANPVGLDQGVTTFELFDQMVSIKS